MIPPDKITPCDVAFLALPTGASIDATAQLVTQGTKVIDLGAAFRLKDRETWEAVYKQKHPQWKLAEEAVYGVAELHGAEIERARVIANPGCFSSSAILGLAPLVKAGLIDLERIVVDGLSGTAGAGAELHRAAHHPEIGNNLVPYNVVGHRHTFEMEQELSLLAGRKVSIHFTPTYVPIVRGILDICHAFPTKAVKREARARDISMSELLRQLVREQLSPQRPQARRARDLGFVALGRSKQHAGDRSYPVSEQHDEALAEDAK